MGLSQEEQNLRQESVHDIKTFEPQDKVKYVFISYKSDDWDIALNKIVRTLQKNYGLRVYFDSNFERHDTSWVVNMQNAISTGNCVALLACVSKKYMKSYACLMELLMTYSIATENKHRRKSLPIIPVIIDDSSDLEDAVTYSTEPVEISEWDFFNDLLEDVLGSRSFEENRDLGRTVKALKLRGEHINEEDIAVACLGLIDDAYVRKYNGQTAFYDNLFETFRNLSAEVADPELIYVPESVEEAVVAEEQPVEAVVATDSITSLEISSVNEGEIVDEESPSFLSGLLTETLQDIIVQQRLKDHRGGTEEDLRNWNYEIHDGIVLLKNYIGAEKHVTVYGKYEVQGKIYKTQIQSFNHNYVMPYMFKADTNTPNSANLRKIQSIKFDKEVDTSEVTNMELMFEYCTSLEKLDISGFDTGQVTLMRGMFMGCSSLKQLNLKNFDTSKVIDASQMFVDCCALIELDLGNFNTGNVVYMNDMFRGCVSLEKLNISSFDTSKVVNMQCMFFGCKGLTEIDLKNFNIKKVVNMQSMFAGCTSLVSLGTDHFDVSGVKDVSSMFKGCPYGDIGLSTSEEIISSKATIEDWDYVLEGDYVILRSYIGSAEEVTVHSKYTIQGKEYITQIANSPESLGKPYMFNSYVHEPGRKIRVIRFDKTLDTGKVTNMSYMFEGCASLSELDISGFDTRMVTGMKCMFEKCASLKSLDLSNFNTLNVTDMQGMFCKCSNLEALELSNFDTSHVKNMVYMFSDCSSLKQLDVSCFCTESASQMGYMFKGCSKLESLDLSNFDTKQVVSMLSMFSECSSLKSLNLSSFQTGKVLYMQSMFLNCRALETLNLGDFDTGQVTNMQCMFSGCTGLKSLNLSSFRTEHVCLMNSMFCGCISLERLDVSSFDTTCVSTMQKMFRGCNNLKVIDVSGFDTRNVENMSQMFYFCGKLEALDVGRFNTSKVTNMSGMFQGCANLKSLDISSFDMTNVSDSKNMFLGCKNLQYGET